VVKVYYAINHPEFKALYLTHYRSGLLHSEWQFYKSGCRVRFEDLTQAEAMRFFQASEDRHFEIYSKGQYLHYRILTDQPDLAAVLETEAISMPPLHWSRSRWIFYSKGRLVTDFLLLDPKDAKTILTQHRFKAHYFPAPNIEILPDPAASLSPWPSHSFKSISPISAEEEEP